MNAANGDRKVKRFYSLTEILVVIGIIGILAAMGVGVFGLVSDRVAYSETETGIKRLEAALQNVKAKFGYLPDHDGPMRADGDFLGGAKLKTVFLESMGGASNFADMTVKIDGVKYFSDGWERPYLLKVPGDKNRNGFDLVSAGIDGEIDGVAVLNADGKYNSACKDKIGSADGVEHDDVTNF